MRTFIPYLVFVGFLPIFDYIPHINIQCMEAYEGGYTSNILVYVLEHTTNRAEFFVNKHSFLYLVDLMNRRCIETPQMVTRK